MASDPLSIKYLGRRYQLPPAVTQGGCSGCAFFPVGSSECEYAKMHLDRTYPTVRPDLEPRGCATEDTVFVEDTEAGWAKYMKAKLGS